MEKSQEFDLHGHTARAKGWRRFDMAEMTPSESVARASLVGLDGVATTDHDYLLGLDEALEAGAKNGIIVVPGVEITALENVTFPHVLALGLDPDRVRNKRLPVWKSVEEVADWIHSNDGIVVAPHPASSGMRMKIVPASLSYEMLEKNIHLFDAVQTHDIEIGFNEGADKIARKHQKPRIGGSDFHLSDQVGIVRTRLFGRVTTWQEVIELILQGKVEPFFHLDRDEKELKDFSRAALFKKRMNKFFKQF